MTTAPVGETARLPQPGEGVTSPVVAFGPVTTTFARRLRALSRSTEHVVCAAVRPAKLTELVDVADALLDGMGKAVDVGGGHSSSTSVIAQAGAWLCATGTTDVVVADAETILPRVVTVTLDWLAGLGIRAWFVAGTPTWLEEPARRSQARLLLGEAADRYPFHTTSLDDLREAFPALDRPVPPKRTGPSTTDARIFPRVPRVDGLMFRSTCRALLDEAEFVVVDARFVQAVRETRTWLYTERLPNTETLMRLWRRQIESCRTVDEVLTVTRGFQVAAFNYDWHVAVDTAQLVGTANLEPRDAVREAENWWERFFAYRTTDTPCLAVLFSAQIGLDELAATRLSDLDWDPGSGTVTVTPPGQTDPVVVDGLQAVLVAAHLCYRKLMGAAETDPLFTTYRGAPLRTRSLGDALRGPVGEIGVTLAPPHARKDYTAALWAARHGVVSYRLIKGPRR